MKEIVPGVFVNSCLYRLDYYIKLYEGPEETKREVAYSNDLAALREYAASCGVYEPTIRHRTSGDDLHLTKPDPIKPEFLQPGSNIWYRAGEEVSRVVGQEFQYFCTNDLAWDVYTGILPHTLVELEYREVSLDFLFSEDIELPDYATDEYRTALIDSIV